MAAYGIWYEAENTHCWGKYHRTTALMFGVIVGLSFIIVKLIRYLLVMKEIKDSPFYKDKFIFKEFSPIEFLQ